MWAALHSTSSGLMGALPTLAVLCYPADSHRAEVRFGLILDYTDIGLHIDTVILGIPRSNRNGELDRIAKDLVSLVRVFSVRLRFNVWSGGYRVNTSGTVGEVQSIDILVALFPSE